MATNMRHMPFTNAKSPVPSFRSCVGYPIDGPTAMWGRAGAAQPCVGYFPRYGRAQFSVSRAGDTLHAHARPHPPRPVGLEPRKPLHGWWDGDVTEKVAEEGSPAGPPLPAKGL